jgi:TolA-binding protein
MTRFLFPSLRLAGAASAEALAEKRHFGLALLLAVAVSGCLPTKAPLDTPLNGEPSEVEVLRADNAELSRRVHELRAEKAELKRRIAVLELEVEGPEGAGTQGKPTEVSVATAPARPEDDGPAAGARIDETPATSTRSGVEESVLLSGSAEATDFDLGRAALEAGSYQSADVTLTRFLTQNPRHPFADDALVLRGRARVGRHQLDAAERDFRSVTDRYPEELVAPEAWLELVRLLEARGDAPGARAASQALLTRYPDSAAASLVPEEFLE